jgi:hypothetical protein
MNFKFVMVFTLAGVLLGCNTGTTYVPDYPKLTEPNAADLLPANQLNTKESEAFAGRANKICATEPNVFFAPSADSKLNSSEIKELLANNTILSGDLDGVFAIYYEGAQNTVGWMPKKTSLGKPDWNVGTVSFDNNQYCRKWDYWNGGVETCWDIHRGDERIGAKAFYFVCQNGQIEGDQHIVLQGNALGVQYSGTSNRRGTLSQDEAKTAYFVEKYFGNYLRK